jgi:hypothetical protein
LSTFKQSANFAAVGPIYKIWSFIIVTLRLLGDGDEEDYLGMNGEASKAFIQY